MGEVRSACGLLEKTSADETDYKSFMSEGKKTLTTMAVIDAVNYLLLFADSVTNKTRNSIQIVISAESCEGVIRAANDQ